MPTLPRPQGRLPSLAALRSATPHARRGLRSLGGLLLATALSACGGGGGGGSEQGATRSDERALPAAPATSIEAQRFLVQGTFGPNPTDIERLRNLGYEPWIDAQLDQPVRTTHVAQVRASAAAMGRSTPSLEDLTYSWWTQAVRDDGAQLRHRLAFALSEIFVVSSIGVGDARTLASYLDMLTRRADGRFRDLLQDVALHPAMGQYLSHLGNRKADGQGRVPDENFAREVMQLFTIGLHQLDDAGRPVLAQGRPIESYTAEDIRGLARVFTGFSWAPVASVPDLNHCFWRHNNCRSDAQDELPMVGYPGQHEPGEKRFLGTVVPAQSPANPEASLRIALDRLASHPNTAPFMGRQLIQRLVTANPSEAYVRDVVASWRRSDGNLRQVIKAVLLHSEALNAPPHADRGKLREPLIRITHLLRALPHTSDRYNATATLPFYRATDTSDPSSALGQSPLKSPSVFNFFRPGHRPAQTRLSAGHVSPEMQITNETSVLAYANFVSQILQNGWGEGWNTPYNRADVQFDLGPWVPMAGQAATLIDAVAIRLTGAVLPSRQRSTAIAALGALPASTEPQKRQQVQAAVLMVAVSPGFVVQQ